MTNYEELKAAWDAAGDTAYYADPAAYDADYADYPASAARAARAAGAGYDAAYAAYYDELKRIREEKQNDLL